MQNTSKAFYFIEQLLLMANQLVPWLAGHITPRAKPRWLAKDFILGTIGSIFCQTVSIAIYILLRCAVCSLESSFC
jgi:hypothetical protein